MKMFPNMRVIGTPFLGTIIKSSFLHEGKLEDRTRDKFNSTMWNVRNFYKDLSH